MIYLFYGEEKYELYKEVEKIKKKFERLEVGVNFFNITKDNITELSTLYNSVNFFGEGKIVIIKDTALKFDVKRLILEADENDSYIIIEDTVDKRLSEYKQLAKVATIKEFKFLNENEMSAYISSTLKKYNLQITKEVSDYMVSICGIDKSNNINEMQKLVAFLGENTEVTKEVIDKVCSKTINAKIFDMLDMAIEKKHEIAINMLDDLIKQKEPSIKVSIMLYKQVKQMYMIKLMKENPKYSKDPNSVLKLHPFVYSKLVKNAQKYSEKKLREILDAFDEYDKNTKIGQMDFDIGLKKLICMM